MVFLTPPDKYKRRGYQPIAAELREYYGTVLL